MSDLNRLPSDPVGFFELDKGYDRRDLKRSYGKAIRQYKPETHPREFQLIRDAYERLEKLLRYGKQQQRSAKAANAWAVEESSSESPTHQLPGDDCGNRSADDRSPLVPTTPLATPAASTATAPEMTLRQLAAIDPTAALKRLRAKKRRSPQDYYLAALLCDAIAGRPTSKYLGQVIEGLIAYPTDPGLTVLATEFLRSEVPDEMAAKIVHFVATKIRSPLFYMLTEPLWMRMVRTQPFEKVERLLRSCESEFPQTEPETRTTFYLRLLRSAIWTAPAPWTEKVLGEIESQSAGLDASSQADLEFLSEILGLLQSQTDATCDDPVRQKLLNAIRLACQAEEGTSTGEIIRLLSEIAKDSSGVQRAFPPDISEDDNSDAPWVTLTYTLVHQISAYLDEPQQISNERLGTQTVHLLTDLAPTESTVTSSYSRAQWKYKTLPLVAWLVVGTVGLAIPLVAFSFLFGAGNGGLAALAGIVVLFTTLVVGFFKWLYPKYLQPKENRMHRKWAMQDYTKNWRSRLFRYSQSISVPMETQLVVINTACRQTKQSSLGLTIQHFARLDSGLYIFAGLQTILR